MPDLTKENTFTLEINRSTTIPVDGVTLKPGPRNVEMGFDGPSLSAPGFDFRNVSGDG